MFLFISYYETIKSASTQRSRLIITYRYVIILTIFVLNVRIINVVKERVIKVTKYTVALINYDIMIVMHWITFFTHRWRYNIKKYKKIIFIVVNCNIGRIHPSFEFRFASKSVLIRSNKINESDNMHEVTFLRETGIVISAGENPSSLRFTSTYEYEQIRDGRVTKGTFGSTRNRLGKLTPSSFVDPIPAERNLAAGRLGFTSTAIPFTRNLPSSDRRPQNIHLLCSNRTDF